MTDGRDTIRAGGKAEPNETHSRLLDDVRQTTGGAPDDRFKKMSDTDLESIINAERSLEPEKVQLKRNAYEEMIRRQDERFTPADHQNVLPKMALLMECLKQGKGIKPSANGGYELAPEKPLSEADRWGYHKAIVRTIELMHNPIAVRQDYVSFLRYANKYADAVKMAESASEKGQLLMKPIAYGKGSVRMMDLILNEKDRLWSDKDLMSDPAQRQSMIITARELRGANADQGIVNATVNADKALASLYLGTDLVFKTDKEGNPIAIEGVRFGVNTGFKPDLAMQAAIRARDTLKYISGNDPSEPSFAENNPAYVSLFGNDYDKVPNGARFNIFLDENRNGKPDLLEGASIENLNNRIRENSLGSSMLVDVGVGVLAYTTMALTRNARGGAIVESILAKAGLAEKVAAHPALVAGMAKTARAATVIGTTVPARHYGYSLMTGGEESWKDSAVHTAGMLLAAEVGSRVGGRATPMADNAGVISKPFQLAKFDSKASSELFAREGYKTTGRVSDMLKASGHEREAAILRKLAPDTPITSPAGRQAIEQAELTYGRLSTAAKAIVKDQKVAAKAAKAAAAEAPKAAPALEHQIPNSVNDLKIKGESAISRAKHQFTDRFRTTAVEPANATAKQIVRARTGSAVYSSFAMTGTYNTIVGTNDIMSKVNGDTMEKYTFLEALTEAHFPSFQGEEQIPWAARYAVKALLGTPGESLFASQLMPPATMFKSVWGKTPELWSSVAHGAPYKAFKTATWFPGQVLSSFPVTKLGLNNYNAKLFSNVVLGPASGFAANRAFPTLESFGSRFSIQNGEYVDPNESYRKMLEKARQPIQNDR